MNETTMIPSRFLRFLSLLLAAFFLILMGKTVDAHFLGQRPFLRLRPGCAVYPTQRTPIQDFMRKDAATTSSVVESLTTEQILEQLREICSSIKETDSKPRDFRLLPLRNRLRKEVDRFDASLTRHSDRAEAVLWKESLHLDRLRDSLSRPGDFRSDAISETYQILHAPGTEYVEERFVPLNRLLRQYLTLEIASKNETFEKDYIEFCKGIPAFAETFLSGDHPEYAPAYTDTVNWLTDLEETVPSAGRIASLLRGAFRYSNLHIQVSSDFLAHAFQRSIDESFEINDCILDTTVRGRGTAKGETGAKLFPNEHRAEIRLSLTTQMRSETLGFNGPVRVASISNGTVSGEKTIFLSEEVFRTTPARSWANVSSRTTGIGANGGPIVSSLLRKVAADQLSKRKPRYDAEARRVAARRLSGRLNQETDREIERLFARYQKELREPLLKSGLFGERWKFQTTSRELMWTSSVRNGLQPCAANLPPELPADSDVAVRVHQSALNNAAETTLAGRRIVIDEFLHDMKEKYPKIMEKFQRDEEDNPLTAITFAEKSPVTFLFKEGVANLIIHIDKFEQEEQEHPGLDITLKYRMKTETVEENGTTTTKIVFEKVEKPVVFPPGFDPTSGARIAGRNLAIRNLVIRRLDRQLKDSFELTPTELGEQWEGKGRLLPQTGSVEKGWFALSWLFR